MQKETHERAGLLGLPRAIEGMALMLFSSFIFSVGNAIIKHLAETVPPVETVFFRSIFSLVILTPFVLATGGFKTLKTGKLRLHMTRGVLQTISMMMFFQAISTTTLVEVNAIEFTSPIFATLLAIFVLGDRVRLRRTLALAAGFGGAIIALWPELQKHGFQSIGGGQALLLGSAFTWGLVLITIRELGKTESSLSQSVYLGLVLTPVSAIAASFVWVWPLWSDLFWLMAVGCTATFGQLAYVQSFRLAEMSAVLPLDFSKLIWSSMIGFLIFSEVPHLLAVVGGTIIFAAGAYITIREAQVARRPVIERQFDDTSPN